MVYNQTPYWVSACEDTAGAHRYSFLLINLGTTSDRCYNTEYICVHMLCAHHADFLRLTCLPWLHHVFGCQGNGGRCRVQLGPCCQVTAELWEWRRAWVLRGGGWVQGLQLAKRASWKYWGSSGIKTHRLKKEISFPLWAERILMSGWIQKLSLLSGNGSTNKINCTHAQAALTHPQALVWLTNANWKEQKPSTHALVVRAGAAATVELALVFLAYGGCSEIPPSSVFMAEMRPNLMVCNNSSCLCFSAAFRSLSTNGYAPWPSPSARHLTALKGYIFSIRTAQSHAPEPPPFSAWLCSLTAMSLMSGCEFCLIFFFVFHQLSSLICHHVKNGISFVIIKNPKNISDRI